MERAGDEVSRSQYDRSAAVSVLEDRRAKAQSLRRLHESWLATNEVPPQVRRVVASSWRRQLPVADLPPGARPSAADAGSRLHANPVLGQALTLLRHQLLELAVDASNELVVCDSEGVVLWLSGPTAVRSRSEDLGFVEGACWSEPMVGTNALGTALIENTAVQIFGAEHSHPDQHSWVCTGAPVHDPATGRLVGAVTLSGPLASAHPHTLVLVRTAVEIAENDLRHALHQQLAELAGRTALPGTGVVVLVDSNGWVANTRGVRAEGRLWIPGGLRPGPVWVPALGRFDCVSADSGWMLRATDNHRQAVPPTLQLIRTPRALARIGTDDHIEDVPLTARQLSLLDALIAAPSGLSASELARAAYGDATHVVATRAEVSRLRQRLGPVIESRPYRLVATLV